MIPFKNPVFINKLSNYFINVNQTTRDKNVDWKY